MATVGSVGNSMHHLEMAGKAGRTRLKGRLILIRSPLGTPCEQNDPDRSILWCGAGIRPTVRGVAMNPIDHPHGMYPHYMVSA